MSSLLNDIPMHSCTCNHAKEIDVSMQFMVQSRTQEIEYLLDKNIKLTEQLKLSKKKSFI
jgi:hypothetical protein